MTLVTSLCVSCASPRMASNGAPAERRCPLDPDFVQTEFPPRARIEIAMAAGNTAPADRRATYTAMARSIFDCAGEGTRIELLPITDSAVGVAPVFGGFVAAPRPGDTNQLRIELERREFSKTGEDAVESVLSSNRMLNGSDPLGALHAAGEALHRGRPPSKLVVVVIGNGWQQTHAVNLFRYRDNPAVHADAVIRQLRMDGTLPDLSHVDVLFVGITYGDRNLAMGNAEFAGLCQFWRSITTASGGTMVHCGRVLPGMTAPF
jgi:hypothetical protein